MWLFLLFYECYLLERERDDMKAYSSCRCYKLTLNCEI